MYNFNSKLAAECNFAGEFVGCHNLVHFYNDFDRNRRIYDFAHMGFREFEGKFEPVQYSYRVIVENNGSVKITSKGWGGYDFDLIYTDKYRSLKYRG